MEQTFKSDSTLPNTEVPVPIKARTHHEKPKKFNGDDFKRWQQKNALLSHHPLPCSCPERGMPQSIKTTNKWEIQCYRGLEAFKLLM